MSFGARGGGLYPRLPRPGVHCMYPASIAPCTVPVSAFGLYSTGMPGAFGILLGLLPVALCLPRSLVLRSGCPELDLGRLERDACPSAPST